MILSVCYIQVKEPLIKIRLASTSIIIVLAPFRATIASIILGQWLVTPGRTISLGRSETAFLVCTHLTQQDRIGFGRSARMRPDLFPDLIAGFRLGLWGGGMYGRHGQSKQDGRDGFHDFISLGQMDNGCHLISNAS